MEGKFCDDCGKIFLGLKFEERHNYFVKKIGSPAQKTKQNNMITHWNSRKHEVVIKLLCS